MTDDERIAGPRALTIGCGLTMLVVIAIIASFCAKPALADHMACTPPGGTNYTYRVPLWGRLEPGVNVSAWKAAEENWRIAANRSVFIATETLPLKYASFVVRPTTGPSYVQMPCGNGPGWPAIIFWNESANPSAYWATHEIGHVLALADHLPVGMNPAGWVNPGVCPPYDGVMSYCTDKQYWLRTVADRAMLYYYRIRLTP